jgi:16S rRNA (uracil1498-N3)-methyltransferase
MPRRYWVEPDMIQAPEVRLSGDVLHHIRDVCRMGLGDRFEILVGDGLAHLVEVLEVKKNIMLANIIESRAIAALPKPYIHLALCVPRPQIFESTVEKMVEMGVASVQPVISELSFWKSAGDPLAKKLERLERIVTSATQQSGRGERMPILEPLNLDLLADKINQSPGHVGLFLYEGVGGTLSLAAGLEQALSGDIENIWVIVGGEGGFSISEVEKMRSSGFIPLTLGAQVLRVETACVATISVLKYRLGQLS